MSNKECRILKCCIARAAQALASRGALSSLILKAGKHRFEVHVFDIRYSSPLWGRLSPAHLEGGGSVEALI
jgi:hypothetical protein